MGGMSSGSLNARLVRRLYSPHGRQAELVLIEPNGDEHEVVCLAKENGTDINGVTENLDYLNSRYGTQAVCFAARRATINSDS